MLNPVAYNSVSDDLPGKPSSKKEVPMQVKLAWNNFLRYMETKGLRGSKELDNHDTDLGRKAMDDYKKEHPNTPLTYDMVPQIQQAIQDHRNMLQEQFKSGQSVPMAGVTDPEQIMGGISPVDGWLGSKTSTYAFPSASINENGQRKDFGLDVNAYNAAMKKK